MVFLLRRSWYSAGRCIKSETSYIERAGTIDSPAVKVILRFRNSHEPNRFIQVVKNPAAARYNLSTAPANEYTTNQQRKRRNEKWRL
jgi:hypothetical protein